MRGLRLLSRGAVLAWAIVLVATLAMRDEPLLEPSESPRARLQVVAVAPPAPAAASSAPEPVRTAPPPSSLAKLGPADLARGSSLLSDAGRFPMLSASYQGLQSFRSYAAAMSALGGRFVVVRQRKIVGEIDLARNEIREASLVGAFSPRARDYSDEPALAEPARRVRGRFGPDAEIMLLVPRSLDAGLFAGIARELARAGEEHADYREIEGRYEPGPGGGLRFRLISGLRMDGRRVPLEALFDLSAIAGSRG